MEHTRWEYDIGSAPATIHLNIRENAVHNRFADSTYRLQHSVSPVGYTLAEASFSTWKELRNIENHSAPQWERIDAGDGEAVPCRCNNPSKTGEARRHTGRSLFRKPIRNTAAGSVG